jgi:hypothetical protein
VKGGEKGEKQLGIGLKEVCSGRKKGWDVFDDEMEDMCVSYYVP